MRAKEIVIQLIYTRVTHFPTTTTRQNEQKERMNTYGNWPSRCRRIRWDRAILCPSRTSSPMRRAASGSSETPFFTSLVVVAEDKSLSKTSSSRESSCIIYHFSRVSNLLGFTYTNRLSQNHPPPPHIMSLFKLFLLSFNSVNFVCLSVVQTQKKKTYLNKQFQIMNLFFSFLDYELW